MQVFEWVNQEPVMTCEAWWIGIDVEPRVEVQRGETKDGTVDYPKHSNIPPCGQRGQIKE